MQNAFQSQQDPLDLTYPCLNYLAYMWAGIAHLVEHWALGHEVLGLNLPLAVLEVTLGSHSSGSLTIPSYKIGTSPGLGIQS